MTKSLSTFGTWPSSIDATMVAGKTPRLAEPSLNQGRLFWLESRAEEKGRNAIMMHHNGQSQCILPNPLSAKSKVHEYGGGSYLIDGDWVYFVLADDQQVYRANFNKDPFVPEALTNNENMRFADIQLDKEHNQLIAVTEVHQPEQHEPQNLLVSISLSSIQTVKTLHEGMDFYAFPRVSPNGKHLTWISWNHPNMPWDRSDLWLAEFDIHGKLSACDKAIEGKNESLFQPQWSPANQLFVVSDRSNWWNIYRVDGKDLSPITTLDAEFATPLWTFNMSTYDFLDRETILATYTQNGTWHLAEIDINSGTVTQRDSDSSNIHGIHCEDGTGTFIGASPTSFSNIFTLSKSRSEHAVIDYDPILEKEEISVAKAVTFSSSDKTSDVYGFYYPPTNGSHAGEGKPPIIVICHGGPTGATSNSLDLKIQYWTNRGFAIMDVNYRGSTGYGRQYRHALNNQWGIFDVEDVCAAAEYACENNLAQKGQCIIKGSSAGGYTVLAALAFKDTFDCGVSLYGIGDLESLVADTHKFEARYLDSLVGQYPQEKHIYIERSPIHHVDQINCPILVFQGLEDKVVPPNQAEQMVSAAKAKGLPVAYITFPTEGHGFRQAESIVEMLNSELFFYQKIFGFDCGKDMDLNIENA